MSTFESRLENMNSEILLASAEAIFKSAMDSLSSSLKDPRGIKEELVYVKEFCSKLKFQYLEQETRDKFLRILLTENAHHVSADQLDEIVKENINLKNALKLLKTEMESVLKTSEVMADEVIALNQTLESRRLEVDEALAGVDTLQNELDALLKDPENENHVALFNVKRLIDTEDIGLNEAIEIAESAVNLELLVLTDLDRAVERARDEEASKQKLIGGLQESLARLQRLVNEEAVREKKDVDPEQEYAQWLRELNSMVDKFVPVKVEVESQDGANVLRIGLSSLVLDGELNILRCSSPLVTLVAIADVNCAEDKAKFWKLSRLLSHIILAE